METQFFWTGNRLLVVLQPSGYSLFSKFRNMQNHENKEDVKARLLYRLHQKAASHLKQLLKLSYHQFVVEGILLKELPSTATQGCSAKLHALLLNKSYFKSYIILGERVRAITASESYNQGFGTIKRVGIWPEEKEILKEYVTIMYRPIIVSKFLNFGKLSFHFDYEAVAVYNLTP